MIRIHFQNISAKVLSKVLLCTYYSAFFCCFEHLCCYFQIWDKSDDENMELLLDHAIRKVEKLIIWDDPNYVKMLYEDGTHLTDDPKKPVVRTFYDLVIKVWKESRGNKFFDKFIAQTYAREISIWRHRMESQKELESPEQIFDALQKMVCDKQPTYTYSMILPQIHHENIMTNTEFQRI